ncbi:hypothetical protein [Massilia sp. ST3]|uniref:hypothetical protein n=1 Tax=Massilia sp. ST3 TaxID=2824903 RepID=UPI001B831D00|nr:hypothetical protein [Massilia sp. ST3]MBQ5949606.1 hypothetical protein [Massilia sp. ST3]
MEPNVIAFARRNLDQGACHPFGIGTAPGGRCATTSQTFASNKPSSISGDDQAGWKTVARCHSWPAMRAALTAAPRPGHSVAARYGFSSFFKSISLDSSLQHEAYIGSGENDKRYRRHQPASHFKRLAGTYP